jgi:tripartite-type tricarboxylate transporter receptor subunit TctC
MRGRTGWWRALAVIATMLATVLATTPSASAQDFPTRRVTLVVAFAPGGPVDLLARVLAERLAQRWGVPVTVENRTGAGGNIAAAFVAKAAPDGYTVLLTATGVAINQSLTEHPGYATGELTPILFPSISSTTIAVNPDNPARTLADFVATHRAKGFTYGTAGIGSAAHLTAAYLFKAIAKVEAIHTPYQGSAQAGTALMGNFIDAISVATSDATPLVQQGRYRGLAISSESRSERMPAVPTLREQGFDLVTHGWVVVMVPADTPPAVAATLSVAFNDVVQAADVRRRLVDADLATRRQSLAEAADFLQQELAAWRKMVDATGLTPR